MYAKLRAIEILKLSYRPLAFYPNKSFYSNKKRSGNRLPA